MKFITKKQNNKKQLHFPKRKSCQHYIVDPPLHTQQRVQFDSIFASSNIYSLTLSTLQSKIIKFIHLTLLITIFASWSKEKISNSIQLTSNLVRISKQLTKLVKVHSQTASNKGSWPIKVHIITEPNLTSKKEIITQKITLFVLYLLNRTAILVMSTDDLNSIGGDSYFESDIEELNSTIVKRPNLTRTISLESSLIKTPTISDNWK